MLYKILDPSFTWSREKHNSRSWLNSRHRKIEARYWGHTDMVQLIVCTPTWERGEGRQLPRSGVTGDSTFEPSVEKWILVKGPIFSKLGKTDAQTYQIIWKISGDKCLFRLTFYKWFKRFKEGSQELYDDERLGRPRSTANEGNIEILLVFLKKEPESSFQRVKRSMLCFILVL